MQHPQVADVACIRGVDDQGEEIPKACVVLKTDQTLSPEELMTFVAERVAHYKKVREVEFVHVIPKSASGKILRRELQAREDQARQKQAS